MPLGGGLAPYNHLRFVLFTKSKRGHDDDR
jgi:hypothetical protein